MKKILIPILLIASFYSKGQELVDSNLPIVIITMDGGTDIPQDPKAYGSMKIIFHEDGERNFMTDQNNDAFLDYNGRIKIESRGSSSEILTKKQYGFSTLEDDDSDTDNVKLLGLPKENDWILNGLAYDPSLMRDHISYYLSRQLGNYAPRTVFCEVVINGQYHGLYMLQEKIKADGDRVDINKIGITDNQMPVLSGGYITKSDKVEGSDPPAAWVTNGVNFVHVVPKPTEVTEQQGNYIKGEFDQLGNAALNNSSFSNGYPSVIDVPSFIDFMLINELSANVDAYQFSTYFHKDRNGKLRAGPIWDLNLTYGSDLARFSFSWSGGLDRSHVDAWQFSNGDNEGPQFWKDLFANADFNCHMAKRWNELSQLGAPLNLTTVEALIDETVAHISEAEQRDWTRWVNAQYSRGEENYLFDTEIENLKTWLSERITWMTENIGSFDACNATVMPQLVISKINYHPSTTNAPSSSDQEFIEILNNGSETVDLTGVYFGGTGLVYQFPVGATLEAGASVVLANDQSTYILKYEVEPFDEFSRSLSNDGQAITLRDGFGNVIDEVTYNDQLPWPVEADGDGYYLELTDANADNADPANWVATLDEELTLSAHDRLNAAINIYPNPATREVSISSNDLIYSVAILDIQGRYLGISGVYDYQYQMEVDQLKPGVYFLEVISKEGKSTHRIVKR